MIQVINRAFDILEFVANEPDKAKSLSEISTALDLNAGTCSNIIKTLVARKYLEQSAKRKGYVLGARAFKLTGNDSYKKHLTEAAREEMASLVERFNENTLLAVLDKDQRSVVLRVNGQQDLQASTSPEKHVYLSATGRLLLSALTDEELRKFIDVYGLPAAEQWEEATDFERLKKELAKIKKEGSTIQITKNQIIGIAVPVYLADKIVAGLSIFMPLFRFSKAEQKTLITALKKSAVRISGNLVKS